MKLKFMLVSVLCFFCFTCIGYDDIILNVPLYAQQTNMWCWAASGEMIMSYLGNDVPQCTQANNRFGYDYCCPVPPCPNPNCIQGGWPEYDKYGFTFSSTSWGTALTWEQLKGQIDSNKPVGFSWGWTGGGGHYMVAKGYTTSYGTDMVAVNDPWPPGSGCTTNGGVSKLITYSEYVSSSTHEHWKDDYNITEKQSEGEIK